MDGESGHDADRELVWIRRDECESDQDEADEVYQVVDSKDGVKHERLVIFSTEDDIDGRVTVTTDEARTTTKTIIMFRLCMSSTCMEFNILLEFIADDCRRHLKQ